MLDSFRTIRSDTHLQPLTAWRESLALAAFALPVAATLTGLHIPGTSTLLAHWVELLSIGQSDTDPALEAFARLRTLLAQCDEDTTSVPGWVLLRLRSETVAYRKVEEPHWRVPTGTPPFETRVGRSAVQLYGRTWLRHGLIVSLQYGQPARRVPTGFGFEPARMPICGRDHRPGCCSPFPVR